MKAEYVVGVLSGPHKIMSEISAYLESEGEVVWGIGVTQGGRRATVLRRSETDLANEWRKTYALFPTLGKIQDGRVTQWELTQVQDAVNRLNAMYHEQKGQDVLPDDIDSLTVKGIDTPRNHRSKGTGKKVARKTKKSTRIETQVRGIRK